MFYNRWPVTPMQCQLSELIPIIQNELFDTYRQQKVLLLSILHRNLRLSLRISSLFFKAYFNSGMPSIHVVHEFIATHART